MGCDGEGRSIIRQRVFWGVAEGVVAAMLIVLAGEAGLTALQQVITVVGLPIFVMVFVMMFSLLKGFQSEQIGAHAIGAPPTKEELKS